MSKVLEFTMSLVVPQSFYMICSDFSFVNLQMDPRGFCGDNLLSNSETKCVFLRDMLINSQKALKAAAADVRRKFHSLALLYCLSQFLSESLFKILQLLLGHTQQTADMSDQNTSPGIIMSYMRRIMKRSLQRKQE